MMGRRRRIALLMLCAVSLSMIVGSSAFTSTSPERSVDVDVVEDENAYLGIQSGSTLQCGNPKQNTILKNQFLTELNNVTIKVRNPGTSDANITVGPKGNGENKTLAPGEGKKITFAGSHSAGDRLQLQIKKPDQGTTPDTIYIAVVDATGSEMTVSAEERKFIVDCANSSNGQSNSSGQGDSDSQGNSSGQGDSDSQGNSSGQDDSDSRGNSTDQGDSDSRGNSTDQDDN